MATIMQEAGFTAGADDGEQQVRPLLERRRRVLVGHDLVEILAGALVVARLQGGEAEQFAGIGGQNVARREEGIEPGLQVIARQAVDAKQADAQARHVAQERGQGRVGRQRFECLHALLTIGLGRLRGRPEARERGVAAGCVLGDCGEGRLGLRPSCLSWRVEGLPRSARPQPRTCPPAILVGRPAGCRQHDQDRQADEFVAVLFPGVQRAVTANVLVDLAKNIGHGRYRTSCGATPAFRPAHCARVAARPARSAAAPSMARPLCHAAGSRPPLQPITFTADQDRDAGTSSAT